MAGYGYATTGYSSYNGIGQSRPMYTEYECSDHVCRPVIVDAEGRKQPIVSYSPNHAVKTERVIEHVSAPLDEYNHSYPTDDYGNKHNHRENSSPTRNPLPLVEESITSVHSEIRPNPRPGILGRTNWNASPHSTCYSSPISYGNSDFNSKEFDKPNANTYRVEHYDGYTKRNDRIMEPFVVSNDGYSMPNHANSAMPSIQGSKLAKSTADISTAVDYLKETAKPFSVPATLPKRRFSDPVLNRDTYADTIDSREAANRYGNFNLSSHPIAMGETYTATIDSREAMRKYGGTMF